MPIEVQGADPFAEELKNLVGAIGGREELRVTPTWGRHILEVLLAAEESSRTGREGSIGEFRGESRSVRGDRRRAGVRRGERALAAFRETVALEFKGKKKDNPVTVLDRDTETFLRTELRAAFPEHGLLGEEHADDIAADARVRVGDRPDRRHDELRLRAAVVGHLGRAAAARGAGRRAASGYRSDRRSAPGAYHARLGGGAWFDDQPVHVSKAADERGQIMALPGRFPARVPVSRPTSRCRARARRCPMRGPPGSCTAELMLIATGALRAGDLRQAEHLGRRGGDADRARGGWRGADVAGPAVAAFARFEPAPPERGKGAAGAAALGSAAADGRARGGRAARRRGLAWHPRLPRPLQKLFGLDQPAAQIPAERR